jgi:hypothetical protein
MLRRISAGVLAVCIAAVFLTAGCSKITVENYEKIEVGMTYDEVVDILGAPDETTDVIGAKSCIWGEGAEVISIKFVGDKVVFHSAEGLH